MEASSVHQRQDIFFKEAQRHGIIVDNWDVVKIGKEKELLEHWRQLPTERRWTALVAWDDLTAYRIWATCHREGVSVPKDFGIIGFDGISSSTSLLQLTTVRVPWREVAQQAIHNLVAMVDGVEVLPLKVLPVEFVTGNST